MSEPSKIVLEVTEAESSVVAFKIGGAERYCTQ